MDFWHYFYGSSATKLPNSSLTGLKHPCWVVSHVNNSMKSHSCPLQEQELGFLFSWHTSTSINEAKEVLHLFQKQLLCFINDDMTRVEVWRVACFYNSFSLPCCCSCMLMQPTKIPKADCQVHDMKITVDIQITHLIPWCWADCQTQRSFIWIVFSFDTINTRF